MRLWHYKLLPYLPDMQLKGQYRELVAIGNNVRYGRPQNHILVNFVDEYPKADLAWYFDIFRDAYENRFALRISETIVNGFEEFECEDVVSSAFGPFRGYMDNGYLDICMMNLYEKHAYGIGKGRISSGDWNRLKEGYFAATNCRWLVPDWNRGAVLF